MNGYKSTPLAKILSLSNGKSVIASETGKYPVYGSNGKIGYTGSAQHKGALVIGRVGAYCGSVIYEQSYFWASDNAIVANVNFGFEPRYAYNLLKSFPLHDFAGGSAQPLLNQTILNKLMFRVPALPIQRKIAAVLSAYDDLIENNNRRIALLEKMGDELYREWFVRLRFPGHESTKIVKGVPEGWTIKQISDLGKVVTGKTPPTENQAYYSGSYPFIKTPDMHGSTFVVITGETLSDEGAKLLKTQVVPENSICVSCIGSGGVVAMTTKPSVTNQQINTIILSDKNCREWAYFLLRGMKETIDLYGYTGATMTNLSKGKFENLKFIHPKADILSEYGNRIRPCFDAILSYKTKNLNLATTRDRLLTRLMSGKIDLESLDIAFPPSMQEAA